MSKLKDRLDVLHSKVSRDRFLKMKDSELLRLALQDAKLLFKLPQTRFALDKFYALDRNGVCNACLAGATLLRQFDGDKYADDGNAFDRVIAGDLSQVAKADREVAQRIDRISMYAIGRGFHPHLGLGNPIRSEIRALGGYEKYDSAVSLDEATAYVEKVIDVLERHGL